MTMDLQRTLETLHQHRSDALVLSTFTSSVLWETISTRPDLDLPYWSAMGKASSTGLGLALALPESRIWVLDGDGSLLMNLGSLVTIATQRPRNLVHIVMDNRVYWTTGGQPIPGADTVDFPAFARAAGFTAVYSFDNAAELEASAGEVLRVEGPVFVALRVNVGQLPGRVPRRSMRMAVPEFWGKTLALAAAQ